MEKQADRRVAIRKAVLVAMLNGHVGIIDNFAGNNFVGNTLITGR